jgi:hypothetical protein
VVGKLTERFDGAVAYDDNGCSEFGNWVGSLDVLSNLLATK